MTMKNLVTLASLEKLMNTLFKLLFNPILVLLHQNEFPNARRADLIVRQFINMQIVSHILAQVYIFSCRLNDKHLYISIKNMFIKARQFEQNEGTETKEIATYLFFHFCSAFQSVTPAPCMPIKNKPTLFLCIRAVAQFI